MPPSSRYPVAGTDRAALLEPVSPRRSRPPPAPWQWPSCKVGAWVADMGGVVEGQEGEVLFRYAGVGS